MADYLLFKLNENRVFYFESCCFVFRTVFYDDFNPKLITRVIDVTDSQRITFPYVSSITSTHSKSRPSNDNPYKRVPVKYLLNV